MKGEIMMQAKSDCTGNVDVSVATSKVARLPDDRHITYQEQYRKCGKAKCSCRTGRKHGPYLYAYWREGPRMRSAYLGKVQSTT